LEAKIKNLNKLIVGSMYLTITLETLSYLEFISQVLIALGTFHPQ
jgi:hypothetical protein